MNKSTYSESAIDDINIKLWNSRFDNSLAVEKHAAKNLVRAEKAEYLKGIAYANLNIAAATFLQSKNDSALRFLNDAFQWFKINNREKGYVRALLIKGNIYESFGDYEMTLTLWLEAFKVAREIDDLESEGESCSQLGLIYTRLSNYPKALEYFNLGLKIREEMKDENAVASSLNRIGMLFRQTQKYDEALEYYFKSLEIRIKNDQKFAIPWTLLGIANTYEDMKKYSESLDYYEKGTKSSDKRCSLQCLMGAGRINSLLGEGEKAEQRLLGSLKMAEELKSYVLIADAYGALAAHYELFRQPAKSLEYYKLHSKAKETYHSNEIQSRLSNIEIAHAIEKSEQEKEIYRLRHVELKSAYDIIEEKNKEITAGINYASRIQRAIFPQLSEINELENNIFILYLPKEIVSGDFYWFNKKDDKLFVVAGDCTGHGVPGALLSMLGISFLDEIVKNQGIKDSGIILNELRRRVKKALHQKGIREEAKDGMDIALCVIDKSKNTIQYSGANNNLYLIRNDKLIEYQSDLMPVGIYDSIDNDYTSQNIQMLPGDIIYMFSDGYADQFGGPNRKKYKYSTLKDFLTGIHKLPLLQQKQRLEEEFNRWRGQNPQIDDVIIMGIKL